MEKSKLIILMGLPGSGKSYWANYIKKKHKARILSGEEMAIKMFGASNCKTEEYKQVYKAIRQQARKLLKNGFTVVIDGTNLEYQHRREIYKEVKWKETILIYLVISDKTALRRLKKRGGCDKKTFYEFKKKLEEPTEEEKTNIKFFKLNQNQPTQIKKRLQDIINQQNMNKPSITLLQLTLNFVARKLNSLNIKWFLGASGALMVHGIEIIPVDLDIFTTAKNVKLLEKEFQQYVVNPLHFYDQINQKEIEFQMKINDIEVEVCELESFSNLQLVEFQRISIPVNPLQVELNFYQNRPGKEKIVKLIKEKLD